MHNALAFTAGLALVLSGCGSPASGPALTGPGLAQQATCGAGNVALGKSATASSVEQAWTPASAAVDGDAGTVLLHDEEAAA